MTTKRNENGAKRDCPQCHGRGFFYQWLAPTVRAKKICGCVPKGQREKLREDLEKDAGS
jgi:hypothetical protein